MLFIPYLSLIIIISKEPLNSHHISFKPSHPPRPEKRRLSRSSSGHHPIVSPRPCGSGPGRPVHGLMTWMIWDKIPILGNLYIYNYIHIYIYIIHIHMLHRQYLYIYVHMFICILFVLNITYYIDTHGIKRGLTIDS